MRISKGFFASEVVKLSVPCYRLYTLCERKKRAAEALSYNGLVQSWPEIMRLAHTGRSLPGAQPGLFGQESE